MIIFFATANTTTQLRSPDHLRGRIMGFYSMCFLGLGSIGSLVAGFIAKHLSAPIAVIVGCSICAIVGLMLSKRIMSLPPEASPLP